MIDLRRVVEQLTTDIASEVTRQVAKEISRLHAHNNDPQLLVDGDRLSELLGVSRATVDRLRRSGVIPSVLIGARRLYRPDAVVAAIEKNQTEKEAADG